MEDNTWDGFDFDAADEEETRTAADLLIALKTIFDEGPKISSREDLRHAVNYLMRLESLHIDPASDAYHELVRLRSIWKKRQAAQNPIDRWMVEHGHPLC